jgi:hypothetical protein
MLLIFPNYTGCLKIREFRIHGVVGDHFSSPNMEIKKKSGLPPQRYIDLKCTVCVEQNLSAYIFFRNSDFFFLSIFRAPLGPPLPRSVFGIREF